MGEGVVRKGGGVEIEWKTAMLSSVLQHPINRTWEFGHQVLGEFCWMKVAVVFEVDKEKRVG